MNNKLFYQMVMTVGEAGIGMFTKVFVSIRETESMHLCISDHNYKFLHPLVNQSEWDACKAKKLKVRRVYKSCSRIAFSTEEKAFSNLKLRKYRQIMHLERDLAICKKFIQETDTKSIADFELIGLYRNLQNTDHIVREHYRFD